MINCKIIPPIDKTNIEKIVSEIYNLAKEVEKIAPTKISKHLTSLARFAVFEALSVLSGHHKHISTRAQTMKKLDKIYDNLAIFCDNEDNRLCNIQQIEAYNEREREELQAIEQFNAKNGIINFH